MAIVTWLNYACDLQNQNFNKSIKIYSPKNICAIHAALTFKKKQRWNHPHYKKFPTSLTLVPQIQLKVTFKI